MREANGVKPAHLCLNDMLMRIQRHLAKRIAHFARADESTTT